MLHCLYYDKLNTEIRCLVSKQLVSVIKLCKTHLFLFSLSLCLVFCFFLLFFCFLRPFCCCCKCFVFCMYLFLSRYQKSLFVSFLGKSYTITIYALILHWYTHIRGVLLLPAHFIGFHGWTFYCCCCYYHCCCNI